MSRRAKIILCALMAAVILLSVLFFNSGLWDFLRYKYDDGYVPEMFQAALAFRAGVEDGELLTGEEIQAFFDGFEGERFLGRYNSMPEGLQALAQRLAERVNARYDGNLLASDMSAKASVDEFYDSEDVVYYSEGITFSFLLEGRYVCEYRYGKDSFISKTVQIGVPDRLFSKTTSVHEDGTPDEYTYILVDNLIKIKCTRETVSLYKNNNLVKELPSAYLDEYMQDAKAQKVQHEEEPSFNRIEKYIESKHKNS